MTSRFLLKAFTTFSHSHSSTSEKEQQWQPKREVFEDKEHVTRAAVQLTVLRRAKTTLPAIIAKASSKQPGTVYSLVPVARDKKPAFEVLVATPEGKTVPLTIYPG